MGDNFVHLDVALGVAERGSVSLAFNPGKFFSVRNPDGQIHSALWPGLPLVATPWVAGASFFQELFSDGQNEPLDSLFQAIFSDDIPELHLHPDFEPEGFRNIDQIAKYRALAESERHRILNADMRVRAFVLLTPLASAGTVALFFLCCLALGLSLRVCLWSTAALAVASPVFIFAGTCWTQPLAMFFLVAANYFLIGVFGELERRKILLSSAFLTLSILVRPDLSFVVLPIVVGIVLLAWHRGKRKGAAITAATLFLPLSIGVLGLLLWNWLRFSDFWVLPGGNQLMLFSARSMLEGIPGLLLSPGAGMLFYFPFVVLAVRGIAVAKEGKRPFLWLALLQTVAAVLFYSTWRAWSSPVEPGFRYLLPVVPMIGLVAACGLSRAGQKLWIAAKGLVLLGIIVQLPGVFLSAHKLPDSTDPSVWTSFSCLTGWWSAIKSIVIREPIAGFRQGIDCLSSESWFFSFTGLALLSIGAIHFWIRYSTKIAESIPAIEKVRH